MATAITGISLMGLPVHWAGERVPIHALDVNPL